MFRGCYVNIVFVNHKSPTSSVNKIVKNSPKLMVSVYTVPRGAKMSKSSESYYSSMNTLLTPIRVAKSLFQTALIIVGLIGFGLFYPVIQLCNGDPFSAATFLVPAFTILLIFTFFYTPWFTLIGGVGSFLVFDWFCLNPSIENMSNNELVALPFAFLIFAILQKYVRNQIEYHKM